MRLAMLDMEGVLLRSQTVAVDLVRMARVVSTSVHKTWCVGLTGMTTQPSGSGNFNAHSSISAMTCFLGSLPLSDLGFTPISDRISKSSIPNNGQGSSKRIGVPK